MAIRPCANRADPPSAKVRQRPLRSGRIRSVYEFDDAYVAPFFGFGTADDYYATQSAINFLPKIRVPTL